MSPEKKLCKGCKNKQPRSEFHKNKNTLDGLSDRCKSCARISNQLYMANPENKAKKKEWKKRYYSKTEVRRRVKLYSIQKTYGLTPNEYERLEIAQRYRCASCKRKGDLVVDHNHETNRVRGLLCRKCNTAAGLLKDDPKLLYRLVKYLRYHDDIDYGGG